MSTIYCFCADFRDGQTFAQRESITTYSTTDSQSGCAVSPIDFGDGERCLLLTVIADSQQEAREKMAMFMDSHGWQPVPIPIDWAKLQVLGSDVFDHIRSRHLINAACGVPGGTDFGKIKQELARKIAQNQKWTTKLQQLREEIDKYQKVPDPESFVSLMDKCAKLHVLPE